MISKYVVKVLINKLIIIYTITYLFCLTRSENGFGIHWDVFRKFFSCTLQLLYFIFAQKVVYYNVAVSIKLLKIKYNVNLYIICTYFYQYAVRYSTAIRFSVGKLYVGITYWMQKGQSHSLAEKIKYVFSRIK